MQILYYSHVSEIVTRVEPLGILSVVSFANLFAKAMNVETNGFCNPKTEGRVADAYEYFNYCQSDPKTIQLRLDIQRKLTYQLIKDESKEQQKNWTNVKKSAEIRQEEVMAIKNRFPTKIPVIVSRLPKEKFLPKLEKNKYLVPKEITLGQFVTVLRTRMQLNKNKSIYVIIDDKSIMSPTLTMSEVYKQHANEDGYLYVMYASQEVFGSS